MFNVSNILSMTGMSKEMIEQLTTIKSMFDKLPKDKQVELVTNFTDALTEAVKEHEGK